MAQAGRLPWSYRMALGSGLGIDGAFLRHFHLTRRDFLSAVAQAPDDAALAAWFAALPGASPERIAQWNRRAPTLGAKGQPGHRTFHLIKWVLYPKAVSTPVGSLFEAINQDEAP